MRTRLVPLTVLLALALSHASATASVRRPAALSASPISSTSVGLDWRDTNQGEGGYVVERRKGTRAPFARVASTGPDAASYVDEGLSPATLYQYRVRARAEGRMGYATRPVSVTTPGGPPQIPPVADLGPDRQAEARTPITLSGARSHDPDGTIVSYAWDLGDGTVASGVAVSHAYAIAGAYVVSLTVTDNDALQDTVTAIVAVEAPVSAVPWTRGFGGAASEGGQAVAVGSDGSIVLAAYVGSSADFGTGVLRPIGTYDLVVAKYSAAGTPLWARRWGGNDATFPQAVAVGSDGAVVVAGYFMGTTDLGGGPLASAGARDMFVVKYSGSGAHVWSRRFGAVNDDVAYGVGIDPAGDVLVGGFFRSTVDFGGGALTSVFNGLDSVVVKLAGATGAHVWSKKFFNNSDDAIYGLALDQAGNPIVTGSYQGRLNLGCGEYRSVGGQDVFVAKLTGAAGACLWSRSFGGIDTDRAQAVAVDGAGDVAVVGLFSFTADFGTGALTSAGSNDGFLVKLAGADGASRWARRFGGSALDTAFGVAADRDGNVSVTGFFQGTADFGGGAVTSAGFEDVFVATFDATGAPRWSRRFGGTSSDQAFAAAAGPGGDVVVTGFFQSTASFTSGPLISAGLQDCFLLALAR